MLTGNTVSTCRNCGSSTTFITDERWEKDPSTDGYRQVFFNGKAPAYCPLCGSDQVEWSDEDVNFWEQALRFADIRVAPDTVTLCKGLYDNWDPSKCTFVAFLREFKAQASANRGAQVPITKAN